MKKEYTELEVWIESRKLVNVLQSHEVAKSIALGKRSHPMTSNENNHKSRSERPKSKA